MATGSPFFNPVFQFTDPNGVPYAGGSLAFYESGTNTPLATYSDSGLTVPNPNPVPLGSGGFPATPIWLQNLEYRVVLSDANGVQIWLVDPLETGGDFTETVVVSGSGSIGFEAINTAADGETWGWYSNPDGSFSAVNSSNSTTAISISSGGLVSLIAGTEATSASAVGDVFTNTAADGQSWSWQSLPTGIFALHNYSAPLDTMYFEAAGNGVMPFDMVFQSTVEIEGIATLSGGVNVEVDPLNVTSHAVFTGTVAVEGAMTVTAGANFQAAVGFTGGTNPYCAGTQSVGFECINTASSGRNWSWVSAGNGQFQVYDFTAAAIRGYFDSNGVLFLSGGPETATITSPTGILTTGGASVVSSGTYSYGLSVANGVTALAYSATSDGRLKSDVEEISAEDAWAYIMAGRPVTYSMASGRGLAGFIAQHDLQAGSGRDRAIVATADERMMEMVDDDGFISPGGIQFARNYDHDIAFLTRAIQDMKTQLDVMKGAAA